MPDRFIERKGGDAPQVNEAWFEFFVRIRRLAATLDAKERAEDGRDAND